MNSNHARSTFFVQWYLPSVRSIYPCVFVYTIGIWSFYRMVKQLYITVQTTPTLATRTHCCHEGRNPTPSIRYRISVKSQTTEFSVIDPSLILASRPLQWSPVTNLWNWQIIITPVREKAYRGDFWGRTSFKGEECDSQTGTNTGARYVHVAQLVEHLARDSGRPGLNPGLFHHYFSHTITFAAMATPKSDSLTSEKRTSYFQGWRFICCRRNVTDWFDNKYCQTCDFWDLSLLCVNFRILLHLVS